MKKLIFILLLFISILSYGQVKYYPGTNRFTNNLTVTGTGKFVLGNDTVTKICSDTLINPAYLRGFLDTTIQDSSYWTIVGTKIVTDKKIEADSADINVIISNKINTDTININSINVIKVLGDTLVDNEYVDNTILDSINNYITHSSDTTYLVRENLVVDNGFMDSLTIDVLGANKVSIDTILISGENVIYVYGDSLIDDDYVIDALCSYYTKIEINDTLTDYYLATKINDTLADYYLSSVVEDTIKERIHDSLIGYMPINYFNGQNIFVGTHSGDSITTGVKNVGIGWYAMHYAEEGNYNTTLGYRSLINNINGGGNIAIGSQAGVLETGTDLLSHATNCVYIGKGSRAGADSTENEVVIGGDWVTGHGTNTVTIGNTSTTANYFTGSLNATTNSNIPFPYGSWYSDTDQAINNASKTFPITCNKQFYSSGIKKTTDSTFVVADAGAYLITYSLIAQSSAPNKLLNVWLLIDSSNVTASNTITKFVGTNQQRVITVTYIEVLTAKQTIQLQCWSDDTSMILEATAAQNTPDRPLCPSVILTINKVSN